MSSGNGLNSGYIGSDQRRTKAGSYDGRKHYLERISGEFLGSESIQPSDIQSANLLLWYSANKETSYVNGNAVNTMTNFGTGVNATSFGTGPAYTTGILNSLPIFRFNNNPVRTSTSYTLNNWTFLLVFNNTTGTEQFERLVDHDYISGFWFGRSGGTANTFGGGVKESADPYGRFVTATDGQWNIIGNQRNSTTHNIWNNGNWATKASGTVNGTATTSNAIGIGGWHNNSSQQAINIDIAELVFYNMALADSDREKVEGYLAWKYNLTSNLPIGHPYKNIVPTV
jgi:hypothetical protein